MSLTRTDTSVLGRWWWTVDRWSVAALMALIGIGLVLIVTASPAVAERIGASSFHFVRRQFLYLLPSVAVMLSVSLMDTQTVRRLSAIGLLLALAGLALVPMFANEIKGSTRWLALGPLTIQPSEFAKPTFAVVAAWMLSEARADAKFPGRVIVGVVFALVASLMAIEPDIGQTSVIIAILGVEALVAGLPMMWVAVMAVMAVMGGVMAYITFAHVQARVLHFLEPAGGDGYQVTTALNALRHGGLLGTGPGEGTVKLVLPDAHTDFILAVAGEEFGAIACLVIVALFAFVVMRGFSRLIRQDSLFVLLAGSGLLVQFGLQAIVNMATTLRLMPAKGMTLPFISYGGSSMLALALGMGMVLSLTRTRFGREGWDA